MVEMNDHSNEIINSINQRVEAALEAIGIHLEGEAKEELENDPRRIDTGLLRNSITHALSGKKAAISSYSATYGSNRNPKTGKRYSAKAKNAGEVGSGTYNGVAPTDPQGRPCVYIGTNVYYAPYVHEGVKNRMAPNRFLTNAVVRNQRQIEKYLKKSLNGDIISVQRNEDSST